MNRVPLPIPPLELEVRPDEVGFTVTEKIALRNGWALLRTNLKDHAKQQFLIFFTEHEGILERFRNKEGKLLMYELHSHPYKTLKLMEAMVFDGLEGVLHMHGILSPIVLCHHQRNVPISEMEIMSVAIADYLKNVLRRFLSPTLENAIGKLVNLLVQAHNI